MVLDRADREVDRVPVVLHKGVGQDAATDLLDDLRILDRDDDQELITAVADDEIFRAHDLEQGLCELAQHLVALGMAVGVVDFLEAVGVQEQDADHLVEVRAIPALHTPVDVTLEPGARQRASELIVCEQRFELLDASLKLLDRLLLFFDLALHSRAYCRCTHGSSGGEKGTFGR